MKSHKILGLLLILSIMALPLLSCFSYVNKGYLRYEIDEEKEINESLNIAIGTTTRDGVIQILGEPDFRYEAGDEEWLIYNGSSSMLILGVGPIDYKKLVVKLNQNTVESVQEVENGEGLAVFSVIPH